MVGDTFTHRNPITSFCYSSKKSSYTHIHKKKNHKNTQTKQKQQEQQNQFQAAKPLKSQLSINLYLHYDLNLYQGLYWG